MKLLADNLTGTQLLLEKTLAFYEKLTAVMRKPLSLDVGLTLSLGVVLSELGEKEHSRECLEAVLVTAKTDPPRLVPPGTYFLINMDPPELI